MVALMEIYFRGGVLGGCWGGLISALMMTHSWLVSHGIYLQYFQITQTTVDIFECFNLDYLHDHNERNGYDIFFIFSLIVYMEMIVFNSLASAVEKPTCTKNVSCPAQPTGQNCTICNKTIH